VKKGVDKGAGAWYSIKAVANDGIAESLETSAFDIWSGGNATMKKLKKCLTKRKQRDKLYKLSRDGDPPEGVK
jgi:hypothetical protein